MLADHFLSQIETFLRDSGMSASAFGSKSVGDPNLVFELRAGRSPSFRIAQKAIDFMDSNGKSRGKKAEMAKKQNRVAS
jgi:hypothetical protein